MAEKKATKKSKNIENPCDEKLKCKSLSDQRNQVPHAAHKEIREPEAMAGSGSEESAFVPSRDYPEGFCEERSEGERG